jgi:metal-dependent amidase/aminoacylase/carboxypeptidase family protein
VRKGGHAAPQEADPVLAAAHLSPRSGRSSRNVHYLQRAVVSVTMIHGGEVHNVIPDAVQLTGTIWC